MKVMAGSERFLASGVLSDANSSVGSSLAAETEDGCTDRLRLDEGADGTEGRGDSAGIEARPRLDLTAYEVSLGRFLVG